MNALHVRPRIRFAGRGGTVAIVALNGAGPAELRRAIGWSRANGSRLIRVAVDGGLKTWRSVRQSCDLFVGDGDSATPPSHVESVSFPVDKDFSDFAGALGELGRRRVGIVCVAGLAGGRLDHEWVNLQELAAHAADFRGLLAPTERGWVVVTARGATIDTRQGRTFSLIALGGEAHVGLTGARWELQEASLVPGSRGLSNVSRRRLRLRVSRGVAGLLFPEE